MKIIQIVADSQRPELSRLILQDGNILTVESAFVQSSQLQAGDDADLDLLASLKQRDEETHLMDAALTFWVHVRAAVRRFGAVCLGRANGLLRMIRRWSNVCWTGSQAITTSMMQTLLRFGSRIAIGSTRGLLA